MAEPSERPEHAGGAGGWAGFLLVSALAAAVIIRLRLATHGRDLFADDAYYYLVIARNLAMTGRATFDGVTATNGFHPLLLALETIAMKLGLAHAEPRTGYLVVLALACALFTFTMWAAVRWARGRAGLAFVVSVTAGLLMLPRFGSIYLNGMESILQLPLLALVLAGVWKRDERLAGLAAAGMVLARLDSLLYTILPIGLVHLALTRGGDTPRRAAWLLAPPLAAAGAWAAFNLAGFGHAVPISGAIKSAFPMVQLRLENLLGNCQERLGLRLGVVGAVAGLLALSRPGLASADLMRVGRAAGVAALAQAASLVLFQAWSKPTPSWYLATLLPMGVFAAAAGAWNVLGDRRWLARTPALAAGAMLVVNLLWAGGLAGRLADEGATYPGPYGEPDQATQLTRYAEFTFDELVWAGTDCGKFAYWSGRPFVNLDGLVNDFAFQRALADRRLGHYLAERGVDRLVFGAWSARPAAMDAIEPMYRHRVAPGLVEGEYETAEFYLYSYVHRAWSDTLRLSREREIWRSKPAMDGPWESRLVVFDTRVPASTATR